MFLVSVETSRLKLIFTPENDKYVGLLGWTFWNKLACICKHNSILKTSNFNKRFNIVFLIVQIGVENISQKATVLQTKSFPRETIHIKFQVSMITMDKITQFKR